MAEHHTGHHGDAHGSGHGGHVVVPVKVYLWVFFALMVLLVLTLYAASMDLGEWNIVIAITIAVVKAVLVVLFFMHLYYSTKLVKLFGAAALFWLAILFALTLGDYFTRLRTYLPLG
jgi:cytochrome c oxidase subunit IV